LSIEKENDTIEIGFKRTCITNKKNRYENFNLGNCAYCFGIYNHKISCEVY